MKRNPIGNANSNLSSPKIVTFNIGGHLYEVSRSLLRQFPESVLAMKAEEAPYGIMPVPISLDRDGERFRYCLAFMRDGRVSLPVSVSKQAVLKDLEFYGLALEDDGLVDESSAHVAAADHIIQLVRESQENRRESAYIRVQMDKLALRCFVFYITSVSQESNLDGGFPRIFQKSLRQNGHSKTMTCGMRV